MSLRMYKSVELVDGDHHRIGLEQHTVSLRNHYLVLLAFPSLPRVILQFAQTVDCKRVKVPSGT